MGEVTIYFAGICTHMQWPEEAQHGSLPGMRRRIVLVNGRKPRTINGCAIPPHFPKLRIAVGDLLAGAGDGTEGDDQIVEWELQGVHLDIANATGETTYDPSFECCIPHLAQLTPGLPAPSIEVVIAAEAEKASCYFEITGGQVSAGLIGEGAATTVLKVQTSDDEPVLRLRRFRTDEPREVKLRSGAQIAMTNVGVEGDDDNDFLLHYETAESIPGNAGVPLESASCCKPLIDAKALLDGLNVGPGCSNSNFP